ncbi:MAG TPA: alpha-ketoglutarate-dependent dioxygenase AlkB, partial [Burkholderiaceae bacterium]|nr:alpha-ketoglutarate-dependent dioxygenase AlkB [Burkholderiaceae bacterium]
MHSDSLDLFERPARQPIVPGAVLLHGQATEDAAQLLADLARVTAAAPLRHLITPGGFRMSVA